MSSSAPRDDLDLLRTTALACGAFVVLLWLIHFLITVSGWDATALALRPGEPAGLLGVATAPLIHGSWLHLFGNTLALLVLGIGVLYGTPMAARIALPLIWIGSGVGVWLFAREAAHVGASGLTYGMMFFIFFLGILRRDKRSIALSLLVFFLYGSMIWGIFPGDPGVSFEYHFFGALAGTFSAFLLRHHDPLPVSRPDDWDDEEPPDDGEPPSTRFFDLQDPDDRRWF